MSFGYPAFSFYLTGSSEPMTLLAYEWLNCFDGLNCRIAGELDSVRRIQNGSAQCQETTWQKHASTDTSDEQTHISILCVCQICRCADPFRNFGHEFFFPVIEQIDSHLTGH